MTNAWKVLWRVNDRRLTKTFEGDKPSDSGALAFAKDLKGQGIVDVYLLSKRKAFEPPAGSKPPAVGFIWCPYCVKWREFSNFAIRTNGIVGAEQYRCSVCTITVENYWVRKFNLGRIRHRELEMEVKASVKKSTRRPVRARM